MSSKEISTCIYVSVKRRQKMAPVGAVFSVLSTATQHVGLAALNSFYALGSSFDGSNLYAQGFLTFFSPSWALP
jgi:hypothetical protein